MVARARNSDSANSHIAADSVRGITEVKRRILDTFDVNGPMTDEAMIVAYRRLWGNRHKETDSSLRTRRSELVHAGELRDTGLTGLTRAGRKCTVFGIDGRLW